MSSTQFGSFIIQSQLMLTILKLIEQNKDKKYFIIIGEAGSGKTTMLRHLNRVIFNNNQSHLIESEELLNVSVDSAIICCLKESAYEVLKKFDRNQTHIVEMPSLAERKADIVPFAHFFIQVLSLMNNKKPHKLTEKSCEKLLQYNWPGNFYELEAVLEQAFQNSLANDLRATIEPEHIAIDLHPKTPEFLIGQKLDEVERKYILQTLYFVHQNRTKAAEILGISIRTLRNKINQYREEGYL